MKKNFHNQSIKGDGSTCQSPGSSFQKLLFHNQRGIALITVILIVATLIAVVIELSRSSLDDTYDAANLSDGIKLAYIAKSGFYGAVALLANSNNDFTSLNEDWAHAELLSQKSMGLFSDGYFMVKIEDETGKIPINKLAKGSEYDQNMQDMLTRLLRQKEFGLNDGKIDEIVDSIKDWIDPDDEFTGVGAENSYYSSLNPPYKAKNSPIDCIEELLMVKGVTKEIFYGTKEKAGLAAYVTADSDGLVNINTASQMVLRSLSDDIDAEKADLMYEYRLKEKSDLSDALWYKHVPGLENVEIKPELITIKGNYFKIISTGKMKNMTQSLSGIAFKSGPNVQTVRWRQD